VKYLGIVDKATLLPITVYHSIRILQDVGGIGQKLN
jgi:hypothetical protein